MALHGSSSSGAVTFKGARVKKSADQTGLTAGGGGTKMAWDAEDFDTAAFHDTVTNNTRLTIPAGVSKVRITGAIRSTNNSAAGWHGIRIYKNGSATQLVGVENDASITAWSGTVDSGPLSVSSGDYFEMDYANNNLTGTTIVAAASFFAIEVLE
jgi:hypothetical protein